MLLWRPPKASMHMPKLHTHRQEHATQATPLRCGRLLGCVNTSTLPLPPPIVQKRFSLGVIARIACSSAAQD